MIKRRLLAIVIMLLITLLALIYVDSVSKKPTREAIPRKIALEISEVEEIPAKPIPAPKPVLASEVISVEVDSEESAQPEIVQEELFTETKTEVQVQESEPKMVESKMVESANEVAKETTIETAMITVEDESTNQVDSNPDSGDLTSDGWSKPEVFKITHYCNCVKCCGKWSGGPTASGAMPQAGRTIAVDKSVIPMGSEVLINGHIYIAEDTGGAIKGNRIDIYCASHQEALNLGVYDTEVSWRFPASTNND